MRKQNSEFLTAFTSEASKDIKNTDYFGFVELDDYACYVIADGIDDQLDAVSARLAVEAVVSTFSEAPSMSRRAMKRCLYAANRALLEAKSKMKLKASIIVVLTNYAKMRYGQAGNIRLRLYRDGFLKVQTTDQSLTMDLVREEKVPKDKVAVHEERNNLYAYLGQEKDFKPYISGKIKLTNADALALYTRDVWQHIDEGEIGDVFAEAGNEPTETVNCIEELLLSRQPKDLNKYTLAVVFINKVFVDPNRKRKLKRFLMALLPILVMAVTIGVVLFIRHKKQEEKREKLHTYYTDTIEYIQMNNYVRAQECCKEACHLAEELKDKKRTEELGNYQKLIEAVMTAEDQLDKEEYVEAQSSYQNAAKRAKYADNLGKEYINNRLEQTADYISVYDFIYLGDTLVLNQQFEEAEEMYLEAKTLATRTYFDEGRTTAIEALEKLYEQQKEQAEAENEVMQEQLSKEQSAANYMTQGDGAYAQGDYESAQVFYTSAIQTYEELGAEVQKSAATDKLTVVQNKLSEREEKLSEADEYMQQAEEMLNAGDYTSAEKYYLLAKDIFASEKSEDKLAEVERRLEVVDIKEGELEEIIAQIQENQQLAQLQLTVEQLIKVQEEAMRAKEE